MAGNRWSRAWIGLWHARAGRERPWHTPSLKQLIPGSEGPFLETYFFGHFSLRLSGNECSRVISMGNFGPTASNLRYEILTIFGWRLEPSCDHTLGAGLDLTCSSFRGLNSDDFPFFISSLGPLEAELAPFKDLHENGDISEISGKSEISWKSVRNQWEPAPPWGRFFKWRQFHVNI